MPSAIQAGALPLGTPRPRGPASSSEDRRGAVEPCAPPPPPCMAARSCMRWYSTRCAARRFSCSACRLLCSGVRASNCPSLWMYSANSFLLICATASILRGPPLLTVFPDVRVTPGSGLIESPGGGCPSLGLSMYAGECPSAGAASRWRPWLAARPAALCAAGLCSKGLPPLRPTLLPRLVGAWLPLSSCSARVVPGRRAIAGSRSGSTLASTTTSPLWS
mmetsp:Transcript_42922/g.101927  ORF Transcript_42922/g.101927 Transcript_42922/m.101927 type:complete len:220 (-) Transcript_42922:997-1656(-)